MRVSAGLPSEELGEFFELMPPMQRTGANWYMGTADAVYQNIYSIGSEQPKYVIVLGGDHIYKMDYSRMLAYHKETNAEVGLATLPISPDRVSQLGVVGIDGYGESVRAAGGAQRHVRVHARLQVIVRVGNVDLDLHGAGRGVQRIGETRDLAGEVFAGSLHMNVGGTQPSPSPQSIPAPEYASAADRLAQWLRPAGRWC